jgi:hypothetical protein
MEKDTKDTKDTKDAEITKWKTRFKRFCVKEFVKYANEGAGFTGAMGFYDTRPYYMSLKRAPEETTVESIMARMSPKDAEKMKKNLKDKPTLTGLLGLVAQDSVKVKPKKEKYDVVFDAGDPIIPKETSHWSLNDMKGFKKGVKSFELRGSDGYFDIRVENATYCYLFCNHNNTEGRKVDMVHVNKFKEELESLFGMDMSEIIMSYNQEFVLKDITYDNPLFPTLMGAPLLFFTDGDRVTYKNIWIACEPRKFFHTFGNSFAVNHFPSQNTVLLLGHSWQPSISCSYDELVEVGKVSE